MRLTREQVRVIREKVHAAFGADARVYLFGSRQDDTARGGDIDPYVEVLHLVENRAGAASRLTAELRFALAAAAEIDWKSPSCAPMTCASRCCGFWNKNPT